MAFAVPCRGVPSLKDICLSQLVAARSLLGDLGDVPVDLLTPVLSRCSAQQLAAVEDETRAGGRDLSSELEPHWQQLVEHRFPQAVAGGCRDRGPQLSGGHSISSSGDGGGCAGRAGAWRALYDTMAKEHAEKGQRIRDKVQRMFVQDRAARQQRCTQVIAVQPHRHGKGRQAHVRFGKQPAAVPSVRQSILKKLALLPGQASGQSAVRRPASHTAGGKLHGRHSRML